jgi:hypothetical protein
VNLNYPDWFQAELDKAGAQLAAKAVTRHEAVTAVRDVILAKADRAFLAGVAAAFAGKALDSWQRARRAEGAGIAVLAGQPDLFPDLPARLYIRPGVAKAVILFSAHDWDTAKAVLENRTSGAIEAARADQAAFDAAYRRVRPLLTGGLTTADVAYELAAPAEAATSPA